MSSETTTSGTPAVQPVVRPLVQAEPVQGGQVEAGVAQAGQMHAEQTGAGARAEVAGVGAAAEVSKAGQQVQRVAENASDYEAEHIKVLEGQEAVRARPGMYIGDTALRGLHHLVCEAVDNSIDEALAGHCTRIVVTLHTDGSVSVEDNGRGIPVAIHPKHGESALTIVMTKLHAGGKFDKKIYKVSGGLHGVGISVTNFLSAWLEVVVRRNGRIYFQRFERGRPVKPVEERGASTERGTCVRFLPDSQIFPDIVFHFDILAKRLRELAFLNKGIEIVLAEEQSKKQLTFKFDGGVKEFVEFINKGKQGIHPAVYFMRKKDDVELEIALQYTTAYQESVHTFANNINTEEGGTHLIGFKSALTRVINQYAKAQGMDEPFEGEDVREGLTAIISIKLPHPQFEGQTKTKLGNSEIAGIVNSLVVDGLGSYLSEHPAEARLILAKAGEAARAREAARKAKELARKGVFEGGSLPGKLADCSNRDPSKCELFIVEGDSAGGCFSGDTEIALLDGRNVTFRQLVEEHRQGKRNFCYTVKGDGTIGVEEIMHPRITRQNARVIKVILDNGYELVCTPDHLFMLRDGSYRRAGRLVPKDSLMPLVRQLSKIGKRITIKGYELVHDPTERRWVFTHLLADEWNIAHSMYPRAFLADRHHVDFNKLNNNPTNITRLRKDEHMQFHRRLIYETMLSESVKAKAREAHHTLAYRRKMSERMKEPQTRKLLSRNAQSQWKNISYKNYMREKFLAYYHSNPTYRERSLYKLDQGQREYWANCEHRLQQSQRVKKFFALYPEQRSILSRMALKQWRDEKLLRWRSEKTKGQWTESFRARRKAAYDKTYFSKTLRALRDIFDVYRCVDVGRYNELRKERRDKTLLRFDTFCQRFFGGDTITAEEVVRNYNHKVSRIEALDETIDVYDIEVPNTHNFALASGIFVHNSCKQGRDREFQAVLPLKGKILNVEKARIHKVFENNEIRSMITAIGTSIREEFDITKARYYKIIIATDADVDGSHIRTLLLTFFYRYMKGLIDAGYIYIAQPPLYKLQRGREVKYAYSDAEKDGLLKTMDGNFGVQRYKGLGEMNPDQLWETTMEPAQRVLKKVTVEDAVEADRVFTLLMGEEVRPRRIFIMKHAKQVVNLDV